MVIDSLFHTAVESKASDLHLIAEMPPYLRIDGVLQPIKGQPKLTGKMVGDLIYPMLTEKQKAIFEQKKELDLSYEIKSGHRFRVNLHFERDHLGLVARVISSEIPTSHIRTRT